jgi:ubiquinone/menaquinone biosynthesis C-methylase UbiE
MLSKINNNVIGIDIEREAIDYANKFYLEDNQAINLTFKEEDIYNLSFNDNYFDWIVSFETLEHLHNIDEYFLELKRVLTPSGKLLISVPDYETNIGAGFPNQYHFNELSLAELTKYLNKYFKKYSLYYQELENHDLNSRFKTLLASILPVKLKPLLKKIIFLMDSRSYFNGRDYQTFKKENRALFSRYAVRKLKLNSFKKKKDMRYVFIAICSQ